MEEYIYRLLTHKELTIFQDYIRARKENLKKEYNKILINFCDIFRKRSLDSQYEFCDSFCAYIFVELDRTRQILHPNYKLEDTDFVVQQPFFEYCLLPGILYFCKKNYGLAFFWLVMFEQYFTPKTRGLITESTRIDYYKKKEILEKAFELDDKNLLIAKELLREYSLILNYFLHSENPNYQKHNYSQENRGKIIDTISKIKKIKNHNNLKLKLVDDLVFEIQKYV
jgi:hypothetical protein